MNEVNVWSSVLSAIEKRINHESFTTWFKPITYLGKEDNSIRLGVPDRVFEDWILNNYGDDVQESMEEVNLSRINIKFEVLPDAIKSDDSSGGNSMLHNRPAVTSVSTLAHPSERDPLDLPLNQKKYTFETFVVGSCNQFAHAAAVAVADSPSKAYNPLYIYGAVGLGKTHLMCAIGNRVKELNRHLKLMYISAEDFKNEMIKDIRNNQMTAFHDRYRSIDVLLIDDIQNIAGKKGTQEEFFHTFNALYYGQKQIVISSDRLPKEIPELTERLHSRFEWGLIADIQPPDFETKVAILYKKADAKKIKLSIDVAHFISSKIKSNVRALEGSLDRLKALSSLKGENISLSFAQDALKNIVEEEERVLTIEAIQKVVADYYNLKVTDLKSKTNSRKIAEPRQIAMYLCRNLINVSFPEIGRHFGGKHHTTVMHSINKINGLYTQDKHFHTTIDSLIASCQ
jgi:chromosomal replication initiator protein